MLDFILPSLLEGGVCHPHSSSSITFFTGERSLVCFPVLFFLGFFGALGPDCEGQSAGLQACQVSKLGLSCA